MPSKFNCYRLLFTLLAISLLSVVQAQNRRITGHIIAADDNRPLPGVSIIVKGKSGGAQTDPNGNFSIDAATGDVLVFSFTGYAAQEVKVGSSSTINLSLSQDASKLGEVVVV